MVHCQRGVNRSGTMAMACVMEWPRKDGGLRTLQEAYEAVMGGRPAVRDGGGPRPAFLDALCRYEKRVRGGEATLDMKAATSHGSGDGGVEEMAGKAFSALASNWGVRREYRWYVFTDVLMVCQPPRFDTSKAARATFRWARRRSSCSRQSPH